MDTEMSHEVRFENRALCVDYKEDYWFDYVPARSPLFPETEGTLKARYICASCPAKQECYEYAIRYENLDGIWGGTDPIQRRAIRKAEGIEAFNFMHSYESVIREYMGRDTNIYNEE